MAVSLLIVPAVSARFWANSVGALCAISAGLAFLSGTVGLVASYAFNQPSGPTIVLVAGVLYGGSVLAGRRVDTSGNGVRWRPDEDMPRPLNPVAFSHCNDIV